MDHFTSGRPKRACGAAARMSVESRSSTPPPTQSPLTAATIGFVYASCFSSAWPTTRAVSGEALRSPLMSAPAQKARAPAPVSTMARQLPRSSSSQIRPRSAIIARDIALSRGWLSMVTTITCGPCDSTRISTGSAPERDDDLAEGSAIGQEANRLHRPLERQPVAHVGFELARRVPADQGLHGGAELVRCVEAIVAQRAAEGGAVLDQQSVRGDLLHATHEADQEHAPAPAERGQRGVGQLAADRIEADVGAPVPGERHHALGEILGCIVDP